jgi:2-haloalkanoic acid dehalogenase type II
MFAGLQPLLSRLPTPNPYINDSVYAVSAFLKFERELQVSRPSLRYNELLPLAYKAFAASLNLPSPSQDEGSRFGSSIGTWPAFPDTVPALQALKKHYKLVILSNIDNDSIAATLSGPLKGVEFDAVYTAQNIGSYKPDLANFRYLLAGVKRDLGVDQDNVLHTAQALEADHVPAKLMSMHGAWINREGEGPRLSDLKDNVNFTWQFRTMGEMAAAVDKEFESA